MRHIKYFYILLRNYLNFALREMRNNREKLVFTILVIALGVAVITAVHTFRQMLESSISNQVRELKGADLEIYSNRPLQDNFNAQSYIKQLKTHSQDTARMVRFSSMLRRDVSQPVKKSRQNKTALSNSCMIRVYGITAGYPFYGKVSTVPQGQWERLLQKEQGYAIVHPDILNYLDMQVGDYVKLGNLRLQIIAQFVLGHGGILNSSNVILPKIYVNLKDLPATGLLQINSRIRYSHLFKTQVDFDVLQWKKENYINAFEEAQIEIRTYHETLTSLQRFLERFTIFLSIVSLVVLFLGGVGAGSALNIFMQSKRRNVALLRYLGLRPQSIFIIYLFLALLLAFVSTILGVVVGVSLPLFLMKTSTFAEIVKQLPFALQAQFSWASVEQGILAGFCITLLFVLLPIWRLHKTPPLSILRNDFSRQKFWHNSRELAVTLFFIILMFAFAIFLSASQLSSLQMAFYFVTCLVTVLLLLFGVAWLL